MSHETKFSWAGTKGPNEITSVTMNLESVPRVGELVEISHKIQFPGGQVERVDKSGRVRDVIWLLNSAPSVTVFLGP